MDVPGLADQQRLACHQLSVDTGCSQVDWLRSMDDRDGWCEIESGNSVLSARPDDDDDGGDDDDDDTLVD